MIVAFRVWREQGKGLEMEKRVKLYALSTCPHCKCTKQFLNDCGVKFDCTDVDKAPKEVVAAIFDEMKRLTSRCSFPTIVIGDKVIVGYREDQVREALGL
jgi:glutaredoxin-like protein NrdH